MAVALIGADREALALDKLNVGKSVATAFVFATIEVGQSAKIWESVGLDLGVTEFRGDAQLQQGLETGGVDIGLGSGPSMGFHAKGAHSVAIASLSAGPQDMALLVAKNGAVKSVGDLKGKQVGVTTAGSLTDWLTRELARREGWGSEGMMPVALGELRSRLAAMNNGEISGIVCEASAAYQIEADGPGKVLLLFGDMVKDFHAHVIFASESLIAKNPDLVRRFLQGWFKTVAYIKSHKAETVAIIGQQLKLDAKIAGESYDHETPVMSDNGLFDPAALEVIRRSLKELGIMDRMPDAKELYTDQFIPVKL
jgi:ABC-type nitrate/sulfonate/bicarbonate transport system substrate-binding protein